MEFKDDPCLVLIPVVLVFIWSSPVVKPIAILIVVIPVLVVLASLFVSRLLLVSSISAVEALSIL